MPPRAQAAPLRSTPSTYRANPALDIQVLDHKDQGHAPRSKRNGGQDASVLADATLKENFPPTSLPKRE